MNPTVLITGATSGIGKATAELLARNNFRIILCGRRTERLEKLKNELEKLTDVTTLQFDVRDKEAVFFCHRKLTEKFRKNRCFN